MMRLQLESALALDEHARAFFSNGAVTGGVVERPGEWSQEDRQKFRKDWQDQHGGSSNAFRLALLWGGLKYTPFASKLA